MQNRTAATWRKPGTARQAHTCYFSASCYTFMYCCWRSLHHHASPVQVWQHGVQKEDCGHTARTGLAGSTRSSLPNAYQPYNELDSVKASGRMVCCSRRGGVFAGAAALVLALRAPQKAQALPRGSIDARVAASFNAALAAGGDPVVRCFTDDITMISSSASKRCMHACMLVLPNAIPGNIVPRLRARINFVL